MFANARLDDEHICSLDMPYFPSGFPNGLGADYTCLAFPNDDNPRDSFIVALIALAGPCVLAR
jgi:hypothetical protein